ncbi:MAG TPA: hypothetical protein VH475_26730 [Tepidisphaeraceae bacterium]
MFDVESIICPRQENSMARFIPPEEVVSPQRRWSLIKILFDPKKPDDSVLALGRWDNRPVLAMRWNGSTENPIGNPQSRGLPVWYIVHHRYYGPIIKTLSPDMQTLARNFLPEFDEG